MRYMSHVNAIVSGVLGNWSLAWIYTFHSGAPLSWGNVIYNGGDLHYDAHNVNHAFDTTPCNIVSSQQLQYNYRTFPTQFNNLRADATNNFDLTITKNFPIVERLRLQFRGDIFNVLNHPLFAAPNLSPTSSSFGTITSTTNQPRVIQMALRLTF